MARLHYVSRQRLMSARASATSPVVTGSSWKVAPPDGPALAVPAWFSLTPGSPSIDSHVGDAEVELTATLATFGGVTEPGPVGHGRGDSDAPSVVLGGNPVAPGTPAGPAAERPRQCTARLLLAAEGLAPERQCLLLAAVVARGEGEHWVQVLLGDDLLAEDLVLGEDRIALLLDNPDDGRLRLELWLRLASTDSRARLGIRGIQGHRL